MSKQPKTIRIWQKKSNLKNQLKLQRGIIALGRKSLVLVKVSSRQRSEEYNCKKKKVLLSLKLQNDQTS